ncbi:family 43 glycosylhydrolase [Aquirufa regiilacus]|uniref:Family 43 glycosylhydrolase n=1 Tax=Aquirufa regiilacus TaxID=3024868 RepID=A0ABU3TP58_9BACT|nr:family 43 glycosylhydrolase [Aquirufa sp. LEOWEIH-7C]MDU0807648.1 family 43 glycosylhydrolase [Aquirufa sp. LEOWEIH-7C]
MKNVFVVIFLCGISFMSLGQKTYCNPMNLDYGFTPIPNFSEQGRHRATADPVIAYFKNQYYLFSTNQWGYWVSNDLVDWKFISRKFLQTYHKVYDELCAPATLVLGDSLLVIGSTYEKDFTLWYSQKPQTDSWKEAVHAFTAGAWDPAFFEDDDKRVYLYHGSSNTFPMYGQEIDRKTLQPIGERHELIRLHDDLHGWERFGEYQDNTFLKPFMEGAWMNKYKGKYYLQYGAPGTEFSSYGDGVYTSDKPFGPFTYQAHNPFSFKPGGFTRGAGHGATFEGQFGNWWHVSTITIAVKNSFERRLGLWPTTFDADGILYTNTAYGDYPHRMPTAHVENPRDLFTGWMLLNYNKPVRVSSSLPGYGANYAVDEQMKTYWSAKTANKGEFIESDLGETSTVHAIQVNYADQDVDSSFLGKMNGIYHQYVIEYSMDGKRWLIAVDKSTNKTDVPHDYVELTKPIEARYIRVTNKHMAAGKFAISGLRVFGKGHGEKPATVKDLIVLRGDHDKRSAWLKWGHISNATGYVVYSGISPDKLYTSVQVFGANEYYFKSMDKDRTYYFQIEAFNENGIGVRGPVIKSE